MKKQHSFIRHFLLVVAFSVIVADVMGQVPQGFNYQATVRNANGSFVANRTVSVRMSIRQGSSNGSEIYVETHRATTNSNGFFNIVIGRGSVERGNFSSINWGNGDYYLRNEIDPDGGSNYSLNSTQQLVSVPYALYAANTDLSAVHQRIDSLAAVVRGGSNTPAANGELPGIFSVSTSKQVKFSKGNLQYQASTDTWRFAENQFDFVGDASNGNVYVGTKSSNTSVSASYYGWIDLFGWGTSGYHDESDLYNRNYQPYETSESIVNSSSNTYGYGPSTSQSSVNLTGSSAQYDWGIHNAISNGGNVAGMWRTLTKDEWVYLLETRNTTSLAGVANARYSKASVCGVPGLIIFPDNYAHPSGLRLPNNVNNPNADFSDSYASDEWSVMENAGSVFLPSAGSRHGTDIDGWSYSYNMGTYHSSTCYDQGYAYFLYFYNGSNATGMSPQYHDGGRHYARSVRLVKDM